MYARITMAHVDRHRVDEFRQMLADEVMPAVREQDGFEGWVALRRDDGAVLVISLWSDRAAAEENERTGFYLEQIGKLRPFLAGPAQRESWEVLGRG